MNPSVQDHSSATAQRCWAFALAAFVLLQCCIMAYTTRLGVPPDEWAHLSYVQDVKGGHLVPDYIDGRINQSERLNYLPHPPLYYSLLGIYARIGNLDPVQDFRKLRLVSAVFVCIGVLLWLLAAGNAGVGATGTALGALALCATPMFSYSAGSINNDALLYLGIGLFFFGISREYLTPARDRLAALATLSGLIIVFLAKLTGSAFVVFFIFSCLLFNRRQLVAFFRDRRSMLVLAIACLVGVSWFAYARLRFGSFLPAPKELYPESPPAQAIVPIDFAWRYAVIMWERLPVIMSHDSIQPFTPQRGMNFFYAMLLVPALAWMVARLGAAARGVPEALLRGTDAFAVAFAATIATHMAMTYRVYLHTGLHAGLQPRYFAFLLPALWLVPLALERRRVPRLLITGALFVCAAAAFWSSVPFVVAKQQRAAAPSSRQQQPGASTTMLGHLDEIRLSHGVLRLRGWAFDAKRSRDVRRINVAIGNDPLTSITTQHQRPDVTKALSNPDSLGSGFDAEITRIPGGTRQCQIQVTAEDVDGALLSLLKPTCGG